MNFGGSFSSPPPPIPEEPPKKKPNQTQRQARLCNVPIEIMSQLAIRRNSFQNQQMVTCGSPLAYNIPQQANFVPQVGPIPVNTCPVLRYLNYTNPLSSKFIRVSHDIDAMIEDIIFRRPKAEPLPPSSSLIIKNNNNSININNNINTLTNNGINNIGMMTMSNNNTSNITNNNINNINNNNGNNNGMVNVSYVCPYSSVAITCPGRGQFCRHAQCIDLRRFIMMPPDPPVCPICGQSMTYPDLRFDPLFFNCRKKQDAPTNQGGGWGDPAPSQQPDFLSF